MDAGLRRVRLTRRPVAEVEELLAAASSSDLAYVNVSACALTRVPDSVWTLVHLTILALPFNELETLPPALGRLCGLRTLALHSNALVALPSTVRALCQLEMLTLEVSTCESVLASTSHAIARQNNCRLPAFIAVDSTVYGETQERLAQMAAYFVGGSRAAVHAWLLCWQHGRDDLMALLPPEVALLVARLVWHSRAEDAWRAANALAHAHLMN